MIENLIKWVPYNEFIGDPDCIDTHLVEIVEEWKVIPDYDGKYQISSFGRVSILDQFEYILHKNHFDYRGYAIVSLSKNKKAKNVKVHRLVAQSFIPNELNKETVNHKKPVKTKNEFWNLEWATNIENLTHAYKAGVMLKAKGEDAGNSKLTKEIILKIRDIGSTQTVQKIADTFNIHNSTVGRILKRKTWNHI